MKLTIAVPSGDNKRLERHLDYVQYTLYALSFSCYLFLGALWGYYKVITTAGALAFCIPLFAAFRFGDWALREVSKTALETKSSEVLTEGKI
jgi:hypothetical protein